MHPFELVRTKNTQAAWEARRAKAKSSAFKAGGIDLLDLMKEGIETPERVVDLLALAALRGIRTDGPLNVGALTTLAELAASNDVRERARALAEAAEEAATPQVRNRATLGGNLLQRSRCWYYRSSEFEPCLKRGGKVCFAKEGPNKIHAIFATDAPCVSVHPSNLAPALVALEAKVLFEEEPGVVVAMSAESLFVDGTKPERDHALPEKAILHGVEVPAPPRGQRLASAYREVGERQSFDWALASAAVALTLGEGGKVEKARVVLGAVAHRPWRAEAAEKLLAGKTVDRELARAAGEKAVEGARPLRDNAFKVPVVKALVARALLAAAGVKE